MDLTKHKIPIKIEDDGLKDAIVIINYKTDYNLEKLESEVKQYLDEIPDTRFEKVETREIDKKIKDSPDKNSDYFYSNGQYKVIVKSHQVAFNCVAEYTGWAKYSKFILGCLMHMRTFIKGSNIKVRYISSYPELPLSAFLDGIIEYPNFRNSFIDQYHTIKCKLVNRDDGLLYGEGQIRLFDSIMFQGQKQSIVDVEIQSGDFSESENNFRSIILNLKKGHVYEKELFYSLLKKEFVDSKNPTYA